MKGSAVPEKVEDRLRSLLGEEGVKLGPGASGPPGGVPVATPAGQEETVALLATAREEGWRVLPVGAGVGIDPPEPGGARPDLLLSSRRWSGVLEYEPADLTIRVGAGTTLAELDQVLAEHGQWLPLDPPGGGDPTVGGVVATGLPGPLAAGFGRPRDQLLGLTMVDGGGRVLELGGRVVKNVAGFDLVRLACGSRGALGVIQEVSLRLYPRSPRDRTLVWTAPSRTEALELGRRLASLPLPLSTLELLDGPRESGPAGPRVLVRLLDEPEAVEQMTDMLEQAVGAPHEVVEGEVSRTGAAARASDEGRGRPHLRRHGLPSRVGSALAELEAGGSAPESGEARLAVHLLWGTVRLWGPEATGGRGAEARTEETDPSTEASLSAHVSPLHRIRGRLRRIFDPAGVLPGAWRDGWT